MFDFIKKKLQKIYSSMTTSLLAIFSEKKIDQASLHEIEKILITADTGVTTTKTIIANLSTKYAAGKIADGPALAEALKTELLDLVHQAKPSTSDDTIFLLLGINGSGKTTFAGKFAHFLTNQGKSCVLVAGDTFRAAASQQLVSWAHQSNCEILVGTENQDPAAIAYQACELYKKNTGKCLIIDTAGRLQSKEHLMREISKMKNVIAKQLPGKKIHTLLTVDAMLGQNSFEQAKIFHEAVQVDGIVLTKIDGTGKGGIIFSITNALKIPVQYISYGEGIEDIKLFDAEQFVADLLGAPIENHE